jgi:hypothetical protein
MKKRRKIIFIARGYLVHLPPRLNSGHRQKGVFPSLPILKGRLARRFDIQLVWTKNIKSDNILFMHGKEKETENIRWKS